MGENLYLASKRGRNQPVWERLGWRLFHQVIKNVPIYHMSPFTFFEIPKHQDPGWLNLCQWPWYQVIIRPPLQNIVIVITSRVVFWNFSWGNIWFERFALCKRYDILQPWQTCRVLERCKRLNLRAFPGWIRGTRETSNGCRGLHGHFYLKCSHLITPSSSTRPTSSSSSSSPSSSFDHKS